MADVLETSTTRDLRGEVVIRGVRCVPVFCGNCHVDGRRFVPVATRRFAFYLCDACAAKWSPLVDKALVPDEVFGRHLAEAMLEHEGKVMTADEVEQALGDVNHWLHKIARDAPKDK